MRVLLISRLPRFDVSDWKRDICRGLAETGAEIALLYSRSSLRDHLAAGAGMLIETPDKVTSQARTARGNGRNAAIPVPPKSLASFARERGIRVLRHNRLHEDACLQAVRALQPDLAVLLGADIVPGSMLAIPHLGTINAHFALLPRYRGMNVAEWSIYHDDPVGVSVHMVDRGIDTGAILLRAELPVAHGDTLADIRSGQRALAGSMILDAVAAIENATSTPIPQTAGEGAQYYQMHPLLRQRVVGRLEAGEYRCLVSGVRPLQYSR